MTVELTFRCGHLRNEENTYVWLKPSGRKLVTCRPCKSKRSRKWAGANRARTPAYFEQRRRARQRIAADPDRHTKKVEAARRSDARVRAKARAYDRIVHVGSYWSDLKIALMTGGELPLPPVADLNAFVEEPV